MIRTSKNKLRTFVRNQYASMLAEAHALSEEELDELGRLLKRRLPPPPPSDAGIEEIPPEDVEMIPDDVEGELSGAQWMTQDPDAFGADEPGAGDTQTMMRTIDIVPGQKRPLAKRFGLGESELRHFISSIIKNR